MRSVNGVERPTLRGLTTGVVKVRSDVALIPCVVFGSLVPGRLFVLRELGYEAVLVVLKSDDCLAEVEDIVGAKCMIWCGSDWGVFGQSLPNFNGRKCCGFVDGRLTGEVMGLVNGMSIQQVVGTKRGRRGLEGWLA
mgnify:CR=1 FL=1